jgi:aspartyl/asparaginyl-tRNA synthetase
MVEKINMINKLSVQQTIRDDIEIVRKRLEIQKLYNDYHIELEYKKKEKEIELKLKEIHLKSRENKVIAIEKLLNNLVNTKSFEEADIILKIIERLQKL